jgi:hypothetical protein
MTMLDWNEYHKQVLAGVKSVGQVSPDIVKGYQALCLGPQALGVFLAFAHSMSQ